ncbi:MAG: DNA-binding protein [Tessaracoccus sp.]|uniref:hypothetical protein n=1 Tax=Tessaracoccus sp. TaxID=1971211 RepID=UPI001EC8A479|nr:hypothetical protein [Tessaracoccus sp.]MBK7822064.1 DNA-binding protein [Tessaracoccus sp.]
MSSNARSAPTRLASARRWASLKEAAEYISVHPKTLTRRFSDGSLIRYRMGRRVMVDLDELDELVLASAGGLKSLAS